jgi:hypothetical protein
MARAKQRYSTKVPGQCNANPGIRSKIKTVENKRFAAAEKAKSHIAFG